MFLIAGAPKAREQSDGLPLPSPEIRKREQLRAALSLVSCRVVQFTLAPPPRKGGSRTFRGEHGLLTPSMTSGHSFCAFGRRAAFEKSVEIDSPESDKFPAGLKTT
jgi:hypothetical protein